MNSEQGFNRRRPSGNVVTLFLLRRGFTDHTLNQKVNSAIQPERFSIFQMDCTAASGKSLGDQFLVYRIWKHCELLFTWPGVLTLKCRPHYMSRECTCVIITARRLLANCTRSLVRKKILSPGSNLHFSGDFNQACLKPIFPKISPTMYPPPQEDPVCFTMYTQTSMMQSHTPPQIRPIRSHLSCSYTSPTSRNSRGSHQHRE